MSDFLIIEDVDNRYVPQWGNKKQFIYVHYLGVTGEGHCLSSDGTGAHYYIYHNGTIFQSVSDDAVVWQVGTAGYYTQKHAKANNFNGIGIEMCCYCDGNKNSAEDPYWYFTKETQESCVKLVAYLMYRYKIPIENVLRHYDVVNKTCPAPYVHNNKYKTSWTWSEFKKKVKAEYAAKYATEEIILDNDVDPNETPVADQYFVGTAWKSGKCVNQHNSFYYLENAQSDCTEASKTNKKTYYVFDVNGKVIYTAKYTAPSGTQSSDLARLSDTEAATKLLEIVTPIAKSYKLLPSVITAQACLESGFGHTTKLSSYNNILGMKASLLNSQWKGSSWDGKSTVTINTPEYYDGVKTMIDDSFRVYPCIEDCIKDICAFFTTLPKYVNAGILNAKNYTEQITIESKCGYATDPNYITAVCNLIKKYKLDVNDELRSTPSEEAGSKKEENSSKTETSKKESSSKEKSLQEKIIEQCYAIQKLLETDTALGKPFTYQNKGYSKTVDLARSKDNRKTNCVVLVNWVLRALGLYDTGLLNTKYDGTCGYTFGNSTVKKAILANFDIIEVNDTPKNLIKKKNLYPGDIVIFTNHMQLIISDTLAYDGGRNNCSPEAVGGKFNRFIGDNRFLSTKCGYIIRSKGAVNKTFDFDVFEEASKEAGTKVYYRVQIGFYRTAYQANIDAVKYRNDGIDCFVVGKTDGNLPYDGYAIQSGKYTVEANAKNRVEFLKTKKSIKANNVTPFYERVVE